MTLSGNSKIVGIVEDEERSETLACFGELADRERIDIVFEACLSRKGWGARVRALVSDTGVGARVVYEKIHPLFRR